VTEQAFFVLVVLAQEPLHGYGILSALSELSAGQRRLKVGTLYGLLERLVREGLVEVDREQVHRGRLRRYYRVTTQGREALAAEAARYAANARLASQRLARPGTAEGSAT
jgi:PadR family transcriptional regulator, regulatory protein PadR